MKPVLFALYWNNNQDTDSHYRAVTFVISIFQKNVCGLH